MTYTIRKYSDKDLDDVLSSWENASNLAHPFLTPEFMDSERYNIPNVYILNTETWVAEHNQKVIGFIALMGNEIGAIFVQPEFHGQGVGRALMDKAQALRGNLEVEVFKENSIGRKFYTQYGFRELNETIHEATGNILIRMHFAAK